MAVYLPAKRVSDPLDNKVKARLLGDDQNWKTGSVSSGSEHDDADPSCFFGLIHAFSDDTDSSSSSSDAAASDHDGDTEEDAGNRSFKAAETVREILNRGGRKDRFRLRLLSDVSDVAEALSGFRSKGSVYRREVIGRLRESGYNAGICKARWVSCGGVTTGNYEYIDVVAEKNGSERRYIVDLEFAAEFEIARATPEYERVVAELPRVMVGTAEEVRQVVRIVADAAKRSLKSRDLHVPPWRKRKYMLAKWLGPYRRTVNTVPSSSVSAVRGGAEIGCRSVGFHAAPPGLMFIVPVACTDQIRRRR